MAAMGRLGRRLAIFGVKKSLRMSQFRPRAAFWDRGPKRTATAVSDPVSGG